MLFVVLCPGTPEGSTGSGSVINFTVKTMSIQISICSVLFYRRYTRAPPDNGYVY